MKHELDEVTQEYLEAVLNVVVQVAEFQYDDTSRRGMIAMVEHLAAEFDIATNYVEITVDENGEVHAEVVDEAESATDDTDTTPSSGTVH